jgi:hypothetical protein
LNILFSTGTIFDNMKYVFKKILTNGIDFKNKAIINKFADLLELFSNTFNSKFKTYYYHDEIIKMLPYQKLFTFIQKLEVNDESTCIIKFRTLFILLFRHLRKDFQYLKSLTSNDFLCNSVLERLSLKKLYRSNNSYNDSVNNKYKIFKDFALKELCGLITKGMKYISIEENQEEFEIGLKIICFMIKRLMFNKEDLILLINSLYDFHEKFYEYIMSSKNNIYSLIDIFCGIVEICYMISVYFNDLVIEESLEKTQNISSMKFIITKSEYSNKLLIIIFKNCDLFSKHYELLIKPEFDQKSKEEKKREEKLMLNNLKFEEVRNNVKKNQEKLEEKRNLKLKSLEKKDLKDFAIRQEKIKMYEERKKINQQNYEEKEMMKAKLIEVLKNKKSISIILKIIVLLIF